MIPPFDTVTVIRDNNPEEHSSSDLVIGDVIFIKKSLVDIPCDLILIQGECILDESSLTGELVPVVKTALPKDSNEFFINRYKKNVLFAGSKLIQVSNRINNDSHALAIVATTGFSSTKGELFRALLFPKNLNFKFYADSFKFLGILCVVALAAFINRVINSTDHYKTILSLLVSSADLITIAVPPALPMVLTVGIGLSIARLRKLGIFCISPQRINLAGRLNLMCWDKTGTLTLPSLVLSGYHEAEFTEMNETLSKNMKLIVTTCHNVNVVNDVLVGHPLDMEMVSKSLWKLSQTERTVYLQEEPFPLIATMKNDSQNLYILSRFEFDSHLQRSSSQIFDPSSNSHMIVCKGSAESILEACIPSTIPDEYNNIHKKYALSGYYVLACAIKTLKISEVLSIREDAECNLVFVGFILFGNQLKSETIPTIRQLEAANIKSIIITGDNAMNAIHVSREIGIIKDCILIDKQKQELVISNVPLEKDLDHLREFSFHKYEDLPNALCLNESSQLAITGEALSIIMEKDFSHVKWLFERTLVFSRAKPDQKSWIIEKFIEMDRIVGMCGDGTNDCGALKASHVGMALSDAEASVVAPFTSRSKKVSDILKLLKEGRCALETSFTAFKFMMLYPIIQLLMAATLYQVGSALADNQYLYDDLAIVLMLSVLMCRTGPSRNLSKSRPPDDLFSMLVLSSIIGQVVICIIFFTISLKLMYSSSWFCDVKMATSKFDRDFTPIGNTTDLFPCYKFDPKTDLYNSYLIKTHENTVVWLFTHFQFIWVALAFSLSRHYRKPFWTNIPYFSYIISIFIISILIILCGEDKLGFSILSKIFFIQIGVPESFRVVLLLLSLLNFLVSLSWEYFIVDRIVRKLNIKREESLSESSDSDSANRLIFDSPKASPAGSIYTDETFEDIELQENFHSSRKYAVV